MNTQTPAKVHETNKQSISKLREEIQHAAHYLPAQGPITAFVHHNTLHAFEDLPFEDAVELATEIYGSRAYMPEINYHQALDRGRIRFVDLESVLLAELGHSAPEKLVGDTSLFDLYMRLLQERLPLGTDSEIQWLIASGNGIKEFRRRCPAPLRKQIVAETRQWVMRHLRGDQSLSLNLRNLTADFLPLLKLKRIENWRQSQWEEVTLTLLWQVCRQAVAEIDLPLPEPRIPVRLPDLLQLLWHEDPDQRVNQVFIRFCAAFADQGFAAWQLPQRELGFYRAFMRLYAHHYPAKELWFKKLSLELQRLEREQLRPEEVILDELQKRGISEFERPDFIRQTLLALRGWAGMLWQLETRPDRVAQPLPAGTLTEYLAVRLLLERYVIQDIVIQRQAKEANLAELRKSLQGQAHKVLNQDKSPKQRAYLIYWLAQGLGWSPQQLAHLKPEQWQHLFQALEGLSDIKRQRLLHRAYEQRFRIQVWDALSNFTSKKSENLSPSFQIMTCIDDREESFRRHLEELDPQVETFGVAGFYGIPMYYRGLWDIHEMPLCPVVIRPGHRILEKVYDAEQDTHLRDVHTRRQWGLAQYGLDSHSHGFISGMATSLFGTLAAASLVGRVLFPRLTSRLRKKASNIIQSPLKTELLVERQSEQLPDSEGIYTGFTSDEMSTFVLNSLRSMGLVKNFSKLVIVMGHGSSSINNPHEAAYNCGACGGGRGGPNARVFAKMANFPIVRKNLLENGLEIPESTYFLGAYHNTCDESVVYYELEHLPQSHQSDFERVQSLIIQACERNAHERTRRFESADLFFSPEKALEHVEARAEDLSQARPEYNHATNAICIVGRRERTQGLFLDRRAFLVSYDPEMDHNDVNTTILANILKAAIPVCAGINLEYYFSCVDPSGWGCGSKLPHNITSLLGVMDGSASDLRPGLSSQMVEIHEPVRLVTIIETQPYRLLKIINENPQLSRLCHNQWVSLACLEPDSSQLWILEQGAFHPYQPESHTLPSSYPSARWYSGLREHLDFAAIQSQDLMKRENHGN